MSPLRRALVLACVGGVAILTGIAAVTAVADVGDHRAARAALLRTPVSDRESTVIASTNIPAAFVRARAELGPGQRFWLSGGDAIGRDRMGFLRLVGLWFFYPAVAVPDPSAADVAVVFEAGPATVDGFEEVATVDGVWIGRRATDGRAE